MVAADPGHNFLSGGNDVLVVEGEASQLRATPFGVQFGKTAIWLPRAGHEVSIWVNDRDTGLAMVLDGEGRGYFPVRREESDNTTTTER